MNFIQKRLHQINTFQQRHGSVSFPFAVVKKYGDDQAGYQAALLTYYGFLSLFPLLILLTTVAGVVARTHPHIQAELLKAAANYFPSIGSTIEENIHGQHKAGLALLVTFLFTLYGARGVADAFRNSVNHVWLTPHAERPSFPSALGRSIAIVVCGGFGFILASVLAGFVGSPHLPGLRFVAVIVNVLILFGVFILLLKLSLPFKTRLHNIWIGALVAAIGIAILQSLGFRIITHQLKGMQGTYGSFAIVLGLLAYIYLQAQIVLYAIEIDSVRKFRLWPRSLVADQPTEADKKEYARLAQKERVLPKEKETVAASFSD